MHTLVTLKETLYGFSIAFILSITFGIVIDAVPPIKRGAMAVLAASNGIPKVVFAPLFFVWLGYGMTPKIAMGALIAFFPILVGFLHGLELVDPSMRRFLATTGAPWRQVFLRVRLPWALRSTVAGCKVAIGLALIGAIVSEFVNASNGLGFLVKLGEDNFELEMQFSGIVAVSILGLLLYLVIDLLDVLFLSRFPPLRQREQD
jgi:NitT/TauT family transport system permease protein